MSLTYFLTVQILVRPPPIKRRRGRPYGAPREHGGQEQRHLSRDPDLSLSSCGTSLGRFYLFHIRIYVSKLPLKIVRVVGELTGSVLSSQSWPELTNYDLRPFRASVLFLLVSRLAPLAPQGRDESQLGHHRYSRRKQLSPWKRKDALLAPLQLLLLYFIK